MKKFISLILVLICCTVAWGQVTVTPATKTWNNLTLKPEITVGDYGYATFSAAITAIGSTSATLILPSGNHAAGGVTVPANVNLRPVKGAVFTVANGTTFTINGPLDAGLYQIFSCTGTGKTVFGAGSVKEVYPEWWTTNTTPGTTDMTTAIRAAVAALPATGGTVKLLGTTYKTTGMITVGLYTKIVGSSKRASIIVYDGSDAAAVKLIGTGSYCTGSDVQDLTIQASGSGIDKIGLALYGGLSNNFDNITVLDFSTGTGILVSGNITDTVSSIKTTITNPHISNCLTGIKLTGNATYYASEGTIIAPYIHLVALDTGAKGIDFEYSNFYSVIRPSVASTVAVPTASIGIHLQINSTHTSLYDPYVELTYDGIKIAAGVAKTLIINPNFSSISHTEIVDAVGYVANGTVLLSDGKLNIFGLNYSDGSENVLAGHTYFGVSTSGWIDLVTGAGSNYIQSFNGAKAAGAPLLLSGSFGTDAPSISLLATLVKIPTTPTYADNAAALGGGLVAGDIYKTATGVLMITY